MLAECAKPCEEQMGDILITATASTGKLNLRKDARDFTEISDTTDVVGCIFPAVWQQPLGLFRHASSPLAGWGSPRGWGSLTRWRSCLGNLIPPRKKPGMRAVTP